MENQTPKADATNLVWLDLEMTGLDPRVHVILQAAVVITTKDLQPLDELSFVVWQPESALVAMSPLVTEMHTKTGLIDRVRQSTVALASVEQAFVERISAWCPPPAVLCGNSIWSDRKFVEAYMPKLNACLHYRMVDVSSLKVLAQRWFGDNVLFKKAPAGQHDATVDVHNSINELRHYRSRLFRGPDATPAKV